MVWIWFPLVPLFLFHVYVLAFIRLFQNVLPLCFMFASIFFFTFWHCEPFNFWSHDLNWSALETCRYGITLHSLGLQTTKSKLHSWHGIAIHSLPSRLRTSNLLDGFDRVALIGSRCTGCLQLQSATRLCSRHYCSTAWSIAMASRVQRCHARNSVTATAVVRLAQL